jgi:hypothetical protein
MDQVRRDHFCYAQLLKAGRAASPGQTWIRGSALPTAANAAGHTCGVAAAFAVIEPARHTAAMLDTGLFRNVTFTGLALVAVFLSAANHAK